MAGKHKGKRRPEPAEKAGKFSPLRAARCLALGDVLPGGDAEAAKRIGVTPRTVSTWRSRLREDRDLQELHRRELDRLGSDFVDETIATIREGLETLRGLFVQARAKPNAGFNPKHMHAVAGALKLLIEPQVVREALGSDRDPDEADRAGAGAPEAQPAVAEAGSGTPH